MVDLGEHRYNRRIVVEGARTKYKQEILYFTESGVVPGNIRMVVEEGEVDGSHSHLVVEVVVRSFEV